MAKNAAPGYGRLGSIKKRTQSFNKRTGHFNKSNASSGKFIDVKSDGKPFKSVRHAEPKSTK